MPPGREPLARLHLGAARDLPTGDLLIRFGFGAAISAVAGIVSLTAGNEPGGILLAFPAILPATLTLVEKEEGERQAEDLDVGSVLGAAALAVFALITWQYMGDGSAPVVLVAATVAWLGAAVLLYLALSVVFGRQGPPHKGMADRRASPCRARARRARWKPPRCRPGR